MSDQGLERKIGTEDGLGIGTGIGTAGRIETGNQEIITDPSQDLFYTNPEQWLEGLRYFLYNNILPKCLSQTDPNYEESRTKLINQTAMSIWIKCFTHKSFNPNGTDNYETIEHMGDTAMKTAFDSAVIQKYPGINEYEITLMNNYYISKPIQRDISFKLGLYKWMRSLIPVTIHVHEDLLEALFGGLFKVGDRVIGKGNGYSLASNLSATIYNVDDIDINEILAHPRSQIKEIIEKMRWHEGSGLKFEDIEKITMNRDDPSKKWRYEIRLTKMALDYIKAAGANIPVGGIIAIAEGSDKKVTSDSAYKQAVEFLKNTYGITREWTFERSDKMAMQALETNTRDRLLKDGYNKVDYQYFQVRGSQYMQLLGIIKTGQGQETGTGTEKTILVTVYTNNPKIPSRDLRLVANQVYGTYGKQPIQIIIPYNPTE